MNSSVPTVALAGNPNCGKTSLFNRLTGLNQKVGNYPGITVERRSGTARISEKAVEVLDLPGTYSLVAKSRDESIAFDTIAGFSAETPPDVVILVLDATNLLRNLFLTLSVLELGRPTLVALNMMDVLRSQGGEIDEAALSARLGVSVVPVVARTGEGVDDLKAKIGELLAEDDINHPPMREWRLGPDGEALLADVQSELHPPHLEEGVAAWTVSSTATALAEGAPLEGLAPELLPAAQRAKQGLEERGLKVAEEIIEARYEVARSIVAEVQRRPRPTGQSPTERLDRVLLHPVAGFVVFLLVMGLLFQSLFAWADPLMSLIESAVGAVQVGIRQTLPAGAVADLLADGVVGGVGNVLVFVPQIAFLFGFIAVLEDSGYLARAAFLSDRLMAQAGLHGRAFVPLLSGFACAVPAIMATRSIESTRDRLVTILVTPLVSCSARLPIYTLIIAALFSGSDLVWGVFSVGGLMMFGLYLLSIVVTVTAAFVLKRTILASPTPPLVLELPPYRRPELASVLSRVYERSRVFVKDAGTVILACSMILWGLLYFPSSVPPSFGLEAKQAALTAQDLNEASRAAAMAALSAEAEAARIEASVAGRMGRALEPAFEPLGYDWKMVVGIIASFAAREVFVSTMGLVYGIGDDADEESVPLRERLRGERDPVTGEPVYTPLVGLSLMMFFVVALQCMSTLAAIRRETASWKWPVFAFSYAGALAWLLALVVYQGGRLLGFA